MTYVHGNCNVLIVVGLGHHIEYYQVSLPVIAGVRVGNDFYYPTLGIATQRLDRSF